MTQKKSYFGAAQKTLAFLYEKQAALAKRRDAGDTDAQWELAGIESDIATLERIGVKVESHVKVTQTAVPTPRSRFEVEGGYNRPF